ncbi:MAG: D-alanine--D-alanine ligase A [Deltaproteobacteria bacterium GWA2_38_16]|nr:MAG: D-alanine--D-alanine ligase A [Deltaproteobacteria bacterium GWA2_38_16]OGQ02583.1 MAG: D-alanine--D-alanine ligase A [Deltaproteobacteria bacterium RIFCSPHIGHO2_02_FULL_38_15]OGQ59934.1 MAG: D-alanine--D-alanine ligase A [Deltaproteobacteria bacterium RIFCSPLOWO2_12_FULL_38_8]HBQ20960.1 D-alanine--D-alanine ligase A [Deltaproteobacteria bacterium]
MAKKIRVGILFGGKSVEHEISILSAKNVAQAIDRKKYHISFIKIDKRGACFSKTAIFKSIQFVDVIFPILHGPFGEDGTVQGMLKLANIPFVGPSVLGSAICMDKEVTKRLLKEGGIGIADFLKIKDSDPISFSEVTAKLGLPFFIKPANLGSSVGIHKVKNEKEFKVALKDAFQFDSKILIEKYIEGREVECAVLGNENPIASRVGEIIPQHEFYSYEAKYLDENGAVLKVPAELEGDLEKRIQELSLKIFKLLECEGMARVDFFLNANHEIIVNEVNTIPGFTKISMYPKLFEASGISYSNLIDRLIQLALKRFKREQKLKTTFRVP